MNLTFRELQEVFTRHLYQIFEGDKSAKTPILRQYKLLMKENKALRIQYQLYNTLSKGIPPIVAEDEKLRGEYLDTVLKPLESLTESEISEGNAKLQKLLEKYISEENETNILKESVEDVPVFYKAVDYMVNEGRTDISRYLENKAVALRNIPVSEIKEETEQVDAATLIERFNARYADKLNENERNVVRLIVEGDADKALNMYQKSIVTDINNIINENSEDLEIKGKLLQLKEKVMFEHNDIERFAGLFEVRQTLDTFKN